MRNQRKNVQEVKIFTDYSFLHRRLHILICFLASGQTYLGKTSF